jgi:hypothetical protein
MHSWLSPFCGRRCQYDPWLASPLGGVDRGCALVGPRRPPRQARGQPLHPIYAQGQLPRRRPPSDDACALDRAGPWVRPRPRFLAKHGLERHQLSALHPGQQLVPCGRHPLDERCEQPRQGRRLGIRPLRSPGPLCSLGHRRLLGPRRGDCCLGRRDSHADLRAVATQFSNSTEAGTSPSGMAT